MGARKFTAITYYVTCDDHAWFALQSPNEEFVDMRMRDHNDQYHRLIDVPLDLDLS
jgi:hypothetical protein